MKYLKIKYRNSCDLAGSVFTQSATNFWYVQYFDVDIGTPTYELVEEGGEDGHKNFRKDLQRLAKKYTFTTVVPEYLFDALNHITLHDTIFITTKLDERSRVFNFTVSSPDWIGDGEYCQVTCTFNVDYSISTNCCTETINTYRPCISCNVGFTAESVIDYTNVIFTDPLSNSVEDGQYYLVGDLSGTDVINLVLYFYRIKDNVWVEYPGKSGWAICTATGQYYFGGTYWLPYKMIYSITDNGAGSYVTVKGFTLPNTWIQLYKSTDGVTYTTAGAVTSGATFQNAGLQVAGLVSGTTYYFKFYLYDNNCNYGFSDVQNIVKL